MSPEEKKYYRGIIDQTFKDYTQGEAEKAFQKKSEWVALQEKNPVFL